MIKKICEQIANKLSCYYPEENNLGLMSGLAGISCFFFHYYRFSGNEDYKKHGYLALQSIFSEIEKGFFQPSFANGLGGIYWMLKYLGSQGFILTEEAKSLDNIIPMLQNSSKLHFENGNYDALHGGMGLYHTERINAIADLKTNNKKSSAMNQNILKQGLSINSMHEGTNNLCWKLLNPISGEEEINFGLAHGIPSILLTLSWIYKNSGDRKILTEMIEPGMNFLLKHHVKNPSDPSGFPVHLKNGILKRPSRMAWCYGDPGIGSAILEIGNNCQRNDWQQFSIDLLRQSSNRLELHENGVYDACICHGSAGLALIYYQAGHKSGIKSFFKTADYWLRTTLDFSNSSKSHDGYQFWELGNKYVPKYGFLEGIAGIGLTLMAIEDGQLPGWEKSLMI